LQENETNIGLEESTALIDTALCIKLSNNKKDLAFDMLTMLLDELVSYKTDMQEAFSKNNTEALAELCHKLHGACSYSGIPLLKKQLSELETVIKNSEKNIISAELEKCFKLIDEVLHEASRRDLKKEFNE
jgi:two-component system sensor histidine kinase BarA